MIAIFRIIVSYFKMQKLTQACNKGQKSGGGQVVLGGNNVSPLVDIGLTDPLKSGGGGRLPPLPPSLLHACDVVLCWKVCLSTTR